MPKYFTLKNINIIPDKQPTDIAGCLSESFYKIHCEKIESLKSLTKKLPAIDEIFFLWTQNSFNAFTFIPFILKYSGQIEELVLATYSINVRIIDALAKQIDKGNIKKFDLLISDSVKLRLPKVYDHLSAMEHTRANVNVIYDWNHSKVALIKSEGSHFIVEGSGNFSENAQNEQYVFLNNERVYDFRKNSIIGDLIM